MAPVPLLEPREGVPPVVATRDALARVIEAFAAGSGPVAVDAERASGYRYGQRAYLVQLRRAGAGTALIDPVACPDLSGLTAAVADVEWVFHAAGQDLPCLAELGMRPRRLFDTELAGRLAGFARVGLGSIVQEVLGYTLEKSHSAVDWSTRPLPDPWLLYAALDVEVLVDLRNALEEELRAQSKLEWALEEFAAIVAAPGPAPRPDPWRRTSGVHKIRRPRQLAVVRSLWETRDRIARERDLSPGRVLPDAAIIEATLAQPKSLRDLAAVPGFSGRATRRSLDAWFNALRRAYALTEAELPLAALPTTGPPPARAWPEKDPAAAARLSAARAVVSALAEQYRLPPENLLAPDSVRRLTWSPPPELDPESVMATLREYGARQWQVELAGPGISEALLGVGARRVG